VTTPGLPQYIPAQLCETVGLDPVTTQVDVCLGDVIAAVRDGGVSAPKDADIAGLRQVVADAGARDIDLKIVYVPTNPPIDTPLRDVAREVGKAYPDATVLVMSPSFAGTYSPTFDRVTLESGQDYAKVPGNPVLSSQKFLDEITASHFPWTPFTIVVVLLVAMAAVGTRLLQVRARRSVDSESPVPPPN
jgi:hypothetical protein